MAGTLERTPRMTEVVEIPAWVRDELTAHAVAELPNEACGLLAGAGGRIEHVFRMVNADHSPMTYRLDPGEQFRVFDEIERRGWDLAAIYHSHTHTEAYPSPTDRRQALYPEAVYILVSMKDPEAPAVRAFRIVDEEVEEREVKLT